MQNVFLIWKPWNVEICLIPSNLLVLSSDNILNSPTEHSSQLRKIVKFYFAVLFSSASGSLSRTGCFTFALQFYLWTDSWNKQNIIISFGLNHEAFKNKWKYNLLSPSPPITITLNKHLSNLLARREYGVQM